MLFFTFSILLSQSRELASPPVERWNKLIQGRKEKAMPRLVNKEE